MRTNLGTARLFAVLFTAASGALAAFTLWPTGGSPYQAVPAEAGALLAPLTDSPDSYVPDPESLDLVMTQGGVVHFAQKFYRRHGDVELTTLAEDPFTFPEIYTQEVWYLLGADGAIREGVSVVRADDGTVVQLTLEHDSVFQILDRNFEVIEQFPRDASGRRADLRSLITRPAQHYADMVQSGDYTRTDVTDSRHGPVAVYRDRIVRMTPSLDEQSGVRTGFTLPYVADLPGREVLHEQTVFANSHLPISSSSWIDVAAGSRVVLESVEWLVFEGLSGDSWCAVTGGLTCEPEKRDLR